MLIASSLRQQIYTATETFFEDRFIKATKKEPKILESIHKHLGKLRDDWKTIFHGTNIKFEMYSMFIHLSPQVKPASTICKGGVELGDILFIHSQKQQSNISQALLLQAKLQSTPINKCQLDLYTNWPKFSFSTSAINNVVNPKDFNIPIPIPHNGGRYLFINTTSSAGRYKTATPQLGLKYSHANVDFVDELINLLNFTSGKSVRYPIIDDWSRVIDELYNWAKNEYYGKSIGGFRHPRIEELMYYMSNKDDIGLFDRGYPYTRSFENGIKGDYSNDDQGFLLIHIITDNPAIDTIG